MNGTEARPPSPPIGRVPLTPRERPVCRRRVVPTWSPRFSVMRALTVVFCSLVAAMAAPAAGNWRTHAPLPVPRSEVAAAALQRYIAVAGGFDAGGSTSARVDFYEPAVDRWLRVTDLPVATNHAMAAGVGGRVFVAGGYAADGHRLRDAFVYVGGWLRLPSMPLDRAAGGAAIIGNRLYVVGGTTGLPGVGDGRRLARAMLAFDLKTRRWSQLPGPPRPEHLGVAALNGKLYVAGGREAGYDTTLRLFGVYTPASRHWRRLAPL